VETFPDLVARLARNGGTGCNITAPLKHEAWKLAGQRSENALRAQAANTLVFRGAGGLHSADWYADSTDGEGLVRDLQTLPGCRLCGTRIAILGAGGAAASVLGALLNAQPELVYVANRTRARAEALARSHAGLGAVDFGTPGDLDTLAPFNLVINATSGGLGGNTVHLSKAWFGPGGICYDMNYAAASIPLAGSCKNSGIPYFDGLGMLVGQAALSFNLWTGKSPDTLAVLEVLRRDFHGAERSPPTPVG
jgi:shikimate dehydrogenase